MSSALDKLFGQTTPRTKLLLRSALYGLNNLGSFESELTQSFWSYHRNNSIPNDGGGHSVLKIQV